MKMKGPLLSDRRQRQYQIDISGAAPRRLFMCVVGIGCDDARKSNSRDRRRRRRRRRKQITKFFSFFGDVGGGEITSTVVAAAAADVQAGLGL